MLLVNLRETGYGLALYEVRDSFWDNPHKPLLPTGKSELANATPQGEIDLQVLCAVMGAWRGRCRLRSPSACQVRDSGWEQAMTRCWAGSGPRWYCGLEVCMSPSAGTAHRISR